MTSDPPQNQPRWKLFESLLHPAAIRGTLSAGRAFPEPEHQLRGPFSRDRDRIIHSSAFRRLMHKTQVYVGPDNDHLRTRLTHTLEVTQLARTAARATGLNEDLAEAIALAHDIGHPPFGHAGERALAALLCNHGGYEHNRHAIRRVTTLEWRSPKYAGLNLSFEVLQGLAYRGKDLSRPELASFITGPFPIGEGQLVDQCDSIAYDCHDLDDALRAGFVTADDLTELQLWQQAAESAEMQYGGKLVGVLGLRVIIRQLVDLLASELIAETTRRLVDLASPQAIQNAGQPTADLPVELKPKKKQLERFLFERVYRHQAVMSATLVGEKMLRELFAKLVAKPSLLPASEQPRLRQEPVELVVGDYLAGMTDRFAQRTYRDIFASA